MHISLKDNPRKEGGKFSTAVKPGMIIAYVSINVMVVASRVSDVVIVGMVNAISLHYSIYKLKHLLHYPPFNSITNF